MGFKPYSLIQKWLLKRNLKIGEYANLSEEEKEFVDYTVKNSLRANPILRKGSRKVKPTNIDFWQLPWSDIIMLRHHLFDKDIEGVLSLVYRIKPDDFLKLGMFNTMAVYKWVADQIKNIGDVERQELDGEPTQEEIDAGVDELKQFDYAVALDSLSGGNLLLEDELLKKPYSVIFRKLCLKTVKAKIQQKHSENASRKAQRANRRF